MNSCSASSSWCPAPSAAWSSDGELIKECLASFNEDGTPNSNAVSTGFNEACVNARDGHHARTRANLAPGAWLGIDGTGQKIGIVAFDTFDPSDVADYLALRGLASDRIDNLSQVHVNGGAPPGGNQDEVLLDVDIALTHRARGEDRRRTTRRSPAPAASRRCSTP